MRLRASTNATSMATAHETGDVLARLVAQLVAVEQSAERVSEGLRRCRCLVEQRHQRRHDRVVGERAQRFDRGDSQQLVGQQRHQAWRHRGVTQPCQHLDGREREEEVTPFRDLDERLHRFDGIHPPQRFDRVELHVDIRI